MSMYVLSPLSRFLLTSYVWSTHYILLLLQAHASSTKRPMAGVGRVAQLNSQWRASSVIVERLQQFAPRVHRGIYSITTPPQSHTHTNTLNIASRSSFFPCLLVHFLLNMLLSGLFSFHWHKCEPTNATLQDSGKTPTNADPFQLPFLGVNFNTFLNPYCSSLRIWEISVEKKLR